ncbi:MAG: CRISPR-associated helicase Cas3' [Candidatus Heimdallarchaeum endolithica]|uniref:CRISPR-associated helicase Cas3 n=1 Tax=Candidatus Heimdallarchaeum endolithica TaxID=2876572 RepID=A0A9Y1BQS4_9ARCH|nr:MAG: CRISPR-associated helicase Cas3' [Candidatus Heimdallarchaeum endolithica]
MEKQFFYFNILDEISYNKFLVEEFSKFVESSIKAHTSPTGEIESLSQHSELTSKIFEKIVKEYKLKDIFENMIIKIYNELDIDHDLLSLKEFGNFIKTNITRIIYFHDFGKINPNYQRRVLKLNPSFQQLDQKVKETIENFFGNSKNHSEFGQIFLDYVSIQETFNIINGLQQEKENEKEKKILLLTFQLFFLSLVLNSSVNRHHSRLKNIDTYLDEREKKLLEERNLNFIKKCTLIEISDDNLNLFRRYCDNPKIRKFTLEKLQSGNTLFHFYKLMFSLLTSADSYATASFTNNWDISELEFNVIDEKCKKNLISNFFNNRIFNQQIKNKTLADELLKKDINSIEDINELRTRILIECAITLEKELKTETKRIFFLRSPTGSGKTNISIKLALDILNSQHSKNLQRINYVFPFINIIEQNAKVIGETLSSENDHISISEIYSLLEWDFTTEEFEESKILLNQMFLNNQINIISSVNFIETFFRNSRKANIKLHNFVNSIIIMDEVQSIPVNLWNAFINLIGELAENYNMYFILMSATLPDLSLFLNNEQRNKCSVLLKNHEMYFKSKLFLRNTLSFNIKEIDSLDFFIEKIYENCSKEQKKKILCVTNTIRNSIEIFQFLKNNLDENNFELYLLNSTILPDRRKEIIQLMNQETHAKNIVLVSTQSVEAGVDIDCDFGFREYAILDSIEQIAGRINRENKRSKEESILYVYNMETAEMIYGVDTRFKVQENRKEELDEFIKEKRFDEFYKYVIEYKKKEESEYALTTSKISEPMKYLKFEDLEKIRLINSDSISIFLPTTLKINQNLQSESEKEYLEKNEIAKGSNIYGKKVWEKFIQIAVNNQNKNERYIEIRKLQKYLNKFTVSLSNRYVQMDSKSNPLIDLIREKVIAGEFEELSGYIKVNKEFLDLINFSYEEGLDIRKLNEVFEQSFII